MERTIKLLSITDNSPDLVNKANLNTLQMRTHSLLRFFNNEYRTRNIEQGTSSTSTFLIPCSLFNILESKIPTNFESLPLYILTGEKNTGKTTTLERWIQQWKKDGLKISGVISRGIFENGAKIGFDLIDIETNEIYPLIRSTPFDKNFKLGKFYFDIDGFNHLTGKLIQRKINDIAVIDEIGPLEIEHHQSLYELFLYYSKQCSVPLIIVVRSSCLKDFKRFYEFIRTKE